mmetsp:Transcript_33780/g.64623  ORF Transcript_33780/g.64623 Transcript_33780/m.64623 type:complete len:241 (+) Transcript_33780:3495-4217(+)
MLRWVIPSQTLPKQSAELNKPDPSLQVTREALSQASILPCRAAPRRASKATCTTVGGLAALGGEATAGMARMARSARLARTACTACTGATATTDVITIITITTATTRRTALRSSTTTTGPARCQWIRRASRSRRFPRPLTTVATSQSLVRRLQWRSKTWIWETTGMPRRRAWTCTAARDPRISLGVEGTAPEALTRACAAAIATRVLGHESPRHTCGATDSFSSGLTVSGRSSWPTWSAM